MEMNGTTHKSQDVQCSLIDFISTVRHDADYNFLPTLMSPYLRVGATAQVCNILNDTVPLQLKSGKPEAGNY